jgi:predicted ATPase/DNA-binding SARP family transcriptional activator
VTRRRASPPSAVTPDGPRVSIRLLGGFEVSVDGVAIPSRAWRLGKAADLVKLLAAEHAHRVPREVAMDALWPDKDPQAAANNLYQALHAARTALGDKDRQDGLLTLGDGVLVLRTDGGGAWIDVDAFEAAVERAARGDDVARAHVRSLYRGPLLPDDMYEDWLVARRDQLAGQWRRLLERMLVAQEQADRTDDALETAAELLVLDPLDEAVHRRAMLLEASRGHRSAALRQYRVLAQRLNAELGTEPEAETEELRAAIERGPDVAADRSAMLPVFGTSFVGRRRETNEIGRLMESARLVTLTGPGGSGKTRLAYHAAAALGGRFVDGVRVAELASLDRAAAVSRAVADAFDVRELPGTTLVDTMTTRIGGAHVLLVLDNCEHLVDAAASLLAQLLAACPRLRVIATSRQPLRVAEEVVFRVPSLAIPPAGDRSVDALRSVDAVALFLDRAKVANPDFELTDGTAAAIGTLCSYLDGLPLALEICAAQLGSLTIDQLVAQVQQRLLSLSVPRGRGLNRQETIAATLDWSHDLLTPSEREVLARFSVFAGGSSSEAAELVCAGPASPSIEVKRVIASLADRSLVAVDRSATAPRYRMLEPIRQYAEARLRERGDGESAETAHLAWAISFASRAAAAWRGTNWTAELRGFELENPNLRAALQRAVSRAPADALPLAESLWPLWLWAGQLVEGKGWLERTIDGTRERTLLRADALIGLSALMGRMGDPAGAERCAAEAVEIMREVGSGASLVRAMLFVAIHPWTSDDLLRANEIFDGALRAAAHVGHAPGVAAARKCLAIVRFYQHRTDEALALLRQSRAEFLACDPQAGEALALLTPQVLDLGEVILPEPDGDGRRLVFQETFGSFRDTSPREAASYVLVNIGMVDRISGDVDAAREAYGGALAEFQERKDDRGTAYCLARIGNLAASMGDFAAAREALRDAMALREHLGDTRGATLARTSLGELEALAGNERLARETLVDAAEAFDRRGDLWGIASSCSGLATAAITRRDWPAAHAALLRSLDAARRASRPRWVVWTLIRLARIDVRIGEINAAQARAREALGAFERLDDRSGSGEARAMLAQLGSPVPGGGFANGSTVFR